MDGRHLSRLLDEAAARRPGHPAVEDERGGCLSYAELLAGRRPAWRPGWRGGAPAAETAWASGCPRASRR